MRPSRLLTLLLAAGMAVAACGTASTSGGGGSATNPGTVGGKMVIDNENGSTWTCQFNPFNGADTFLSFGFVYEELYYVDTLKTNADGSNVSTPWLATAYQWSNSDQTLTFTIRSGVTWNDGQPFSAQDVAYTFNLESQYSAMDALGLWKADGGPLTAVTAQGDQVTFTFDAPAQTYFYYVADQTPIVSQHIFSAVPTSQLTNNSYADSKPVGTGPYTVSSCSPNNIQYSRNPHYWQSTASHPVPQVQTLEYPAYLSNSSANLVLRQGGAQWGAQYIPNIQSYYISPDPSHRHYWFPPAENVGIYINTTAPLLDIVAVRQAISDAIDRSQVSQRGEDGYEPPANQTGIVTPTFDAWYDKSIDNTTYSVSKADQLLESAGFTKGSDGIYQNAQGQPLSFTLQTVTGYTDWDSSLQVIQQELQQAGIQVKVVDEDNSSVLQPNLQKGNFTLAYYEQPSGGPSPYYELRDALFSGNIGSTNYSQWKDSQTDQLFDSFATASSTSDQVSIMHQIEQIMVNDVPFIPVTEGVTWYQYDTTSFGGWPTSQDPYALPAVWAYPDEGVVLTHLFPLS
ncbi:MAG TPA: ABC transporter substrate-binding protein [Candidatus Binatia bacterium]|nr:ABC transporter substrate-binding protein [Candidatus Binatia bacterium]